MQMVNVHIRLPEIRDVELALATVPNGASKAMVRALNRTIVGVRDDVLRAIKDTYLVRDREFRGLMKIRNASSKRLSASITVRDHPLGVERFQITPRKRISGRRRAPMGIHVRVRRDSPGNILPGTFLGIGRISNALLVFRRLTDDRLPLEHIHGPAFSSMLKMSWDNPELSIQEHADERLLRELDHQVEYLLSEAAK